VPKPAPATGSRHWPETRVSDPFDDTRDDTPAETRVDDRFDDTRHEPRAETRVSDRFQTLARTRVATGLTKRVPKPS
jgi:hypothetical protein